MFDIGESITLISFMKDRNRFYVDYFGSHTIDNIVGTTGDLVLEIYDRLYYYGEDDLYRKNNNFGYGLTERNEASVFANNYRDTRLCDNSQVSFIREYTEKYNRMFNLIENLSNPKNKKLITIEDMDDVINKLERIELL